MNRRQFLSSGATAAAAMATNAASRRPPNIVYVMLDDLGYADFGCYGQKLIRTPNVDRFAREGLRFTDCYAGSTVCAPSRCVLMTGMHSGHGSIRTNAGTMPLLASDRTVASALKQAGYATGAFGKWGLGDIRTDGVPWKHGFDEFYGYLHQVHAHSYYPDFLWDNDRRDLLKGNHEGQGSDYSADRIAERTFDFVRRRRNEPFFLYACWTLPHGKYEIPDVTSYEKEPWAPVEKAYAAMVTKADHQFGRLLDVLEENGLAENTVVFLTSDNGGVDANSRKFDRFQSNGTLRGAKGNLYEGGIRVPMMARWPGVTKSKSGSAAPWAFHDFYPTACEIAGAPAPSGLDGRSVVPLLRGDTLDAERPLYWEFFPFDFKNQRYRLEALQQAVRVGKWKAVRPRPDKPVELYDLSTDPGESRNAAPDHPVLVTRLEGVMRAQHTEPRKPEGPLSLDFAKA
ncbi:MAG: arylsulfatase [Bryobacterales bacterium]|nr:arylsulfatase [Bryobacterales bacterium]